MMRMMTMLAALLLVCPMGGCTDEPAEATGPVAQAEEAPTPERATRPVALEWAYAEDLLAVGVEPVGVADPDGFRKWVATDPALPTSVASVGTRQEPSLEAIVQLRPDLILGLAARHGAVEDTLRSIAPTLLFEPYELPDGQTQYQEMRQTFERIAEAVGRSERAGAVLDELDASLAAARKQVQAMPADDRRFILVQTYSAKNAPVLRVFTGDAMAVQILEQMGLTNAWSSETSNYGFSTVGLDALMDVADVHLLYVAQAEDDPLGEELRDHPVWRQLPMVASGKVHPLGGDVWLFGGPISARLLIDRVLTALEGSGP